jgi:Uma2 family endonuclease
MLDYMPDDVLPAKRHATYQDVIDAPENMVAEILDGDLFLSPRPAPKHAFSTSLLSATLITTFGRRKGGLGGWLILVEPELHIGPDVVVPDLAGWKRERIPRPPKEAHFRKAPDWACEVLSRSTEKIDRTRKLRIYAREGVSYVWFVDPVRRTVEIRERQGIGWLEPIILRDHHETVRAAPFEALEIDLSELWF